MQGFSLINNNVRDNKPFSTKKSLNLNFKKQTPQMQVGSYKYLMNKPMKLAKLYLGNRVGIIGIKNNREAEECGLWNGHMPVGL